MAVQLLKLISGELVLANTSKSLDESVTLHNPATLVMTPQGAGLIPFCVMSKTEKFTLKKDHILFSEDADPELANAYNQQYGSGIVTASSSIIT